MNHKRLERWKTVLTIPWPLMVLPASLFMDHKEAVLISWRFVILYMLVSAGILTWRFKQGKWKSLSVIGQ